MHLLFKDIPSSDAGGDAELAWAKSSFFLRSHCGATGGEQPADGPKATMICFGAVKHFKDRCLQMRLSDEWESILEHPEILVAYYLESWYERVNNVVWNAHDRARELENVGRKTNSQDREAD
jgi:hypothetical protein